MDKLAGAGAAQWPLVLFFGLFTVVGTGMWINTLWGLLTGGPRDHTKPGHPHVYDRLYYVLFLAGLIGWTMALLSFLAPVSSGKMDEISGFMIGWGIMAVSMGLLMRLRGEMMLNGAKYLSKHGFIAWRIFYAMHVRQREQQPMAWKYIPLLFPIVGVGVLLFFLPHWAEVPGQMATGTKVLLAMMTRAAHGQV